MLLKIWYMICFALFGLIDQRRGSAVGEVQMMFGNMTGVIVALMLIPSLDFKRLKDKVYIIWTPICLILTVILCVRGSSFRFYSQQWISGVLNFTVWSYFGIYLLKERKSLGLLQRVRQPFFCSLALMLLLMQLSVHEGILPLWYLVIFGGFYLLGVPEGNRESFWSGMLNGIILWFFIQQIIAFGFRPYDFVRYRGLYAGETQNGLFYMIVYCAFLVKWIWSKEKKAARVWTFLYFILSASCIGFIIFTGGRAPLLGAGMVTLAIYVWYDLVYRKSFYKWVLHCAAFGVCIVLTFPVIYGCIRYLPVILHHPIWFEGEYDESSSVRSFDPWDSERYISFEEAFESNIGRFLSAVGIDYKVLTDRLTNSFGTMKVYAEENTESLELSEPGSDRENPFVLDDTDMNSSFSIRKTIYVYYWNHLNMTGHSKDESGFYFSYNTYFGHAHNMFLQVAYDYGIPAGILFAGVYIYSLLQVFWKRKKENVICAAFLLAIFSFGMAEMVLVPGQITVVLIGLMFYFAGEDNNRYTSR